MDEYRNNNFKSWLEWAGMKSTYDGERGSKGEKQVHRNCVGIYG